MITVGGRSRLPWIFSDYYWRILMNSKRAGTSWGLTRHIVLEILKTLLFSLLVLELSYSLLVSILAAGKYAIDLPLA